MWCLNKMVRRACPAWHLVCHWCSYSSPVPVCLLNWSIWVSPLAPYTLPLICQWKFTRNGTTKPSHKLLCKIPSLYLVLNSSPTLYCSPVSLLWRGPQGQLRPSPVTDSVPNLPEDTRIGPPLHWSSWCSLAGEAGGLLFGLCFM